MRIGIVGAGLAGLACAETLTGRGHHVLLVDKGREPGGRMSCRRIQTSAGEAAFDHGAQYFTARDDAFRRQVESWISEGVPLPSLAGESCRRWRFARSGKEGAGALFDRDRRLGVCGDWLIGPRVEAAWLSGTGLPSEIDLDGSDRPL